MSLGLKNEVPEKRKDIANFDDEPKPIVLPKHPEAIIQSLLPEEGLRKRRHPSCARETTYLTQQTNLQSRNSNLRSPIKSRFGILETRDSKIGNLRSFRCRLPYFRETFSSTRCSICSSFLTSKTFGTCRAAMYARSLSP